MLMLKVTLTPQVMASCALFSDDKGEINQVKMSIQFKAFKERYFEQNNYITIALSKPLQNIKSFLFALQNV